MTLTMHDIESRAKEQASGIQQINDAIMQMDEVTQRNAALVEELASSSEDLSKIATELAGEVGAFKVSGDSGYSENYKKSAAKKVSQKPATKPAAKPVAKEIPKSAVKATVPESLNKLVSETPKQEVKSPAPTSAPKPNKSSADFFDDDKFEEF